MAHNILHMRTFLKISNFKSWRFNRHNTWMR